MRGTLVPGLRSGRILLMVGVLCVLCAGLAWGAGELPAQPAGDKVQASEALKTGEADFLASLDAANKDVPEEKEAPLYVTALSFIFKLAIVLGLAYVTILALKKFSVGRGTHGSGQHRIRVVENSSLGASKSLHLVEIGGKRLLLASTPNQVNLIAEMAAEELSEPSEPPPASGFKDQLAMFMGAKPQGEPAERNVAQMLRESSAFVQSKIGEIGGIRRKLRNGENA